MSVKNLIAAAALWLQATTLWASVDKTDEWHIVADDFSNYNGVTLANGTIGIQTSDKLLEVGDVVLNNVYMSRRPGDVSRIARGPQFLNLVIGIDGKTLTDSNVSHKRQVLDMKEAKMKMIFDADGAAISYEIMAMRNLPYMGLVRVRVKAKRDINIDVKNRTSFATEYVDCSADFKNLRDGSHIMPLMVSRAISYDRSVAVASATAFLFPTEEHPEIVSEDVVDGYPAMKFVTDLKKGQTLEFSLMGAVTNSIEFPNLDADVERMAVYALRSDPDTLVDGHKKEWERLWESDIIIEGDAESQRDVRLALYHLYSFGGEGTRNSIAPMGLSTVTGYNGHVFWDTEMWMYPPLLMLNQDMARSCIDYRTDRLPQACRRARHYGFGGAMYPWESDRSGEEATPTWCLTGTFEHHISADIAIAFWNYYRVTRDVDWLRSEGYEVMKNVADFWKSRATLNTDGSYSIKNVVGANEYAANIDDNAFTNGAAKRALEYTVKAADVVGVAPDPKWKKIADGLKFYQMSDGTTMEHSKYAGEIVKQADVNLLAYPLEIVTDRNRILADVEYYAKKIDGNGPAMGNSILAILYSQSGDADKAYEFFHKAFVPNKRPPFGVLSESANSNNPYFCTGAGGLIQVVLSGFAGLRFTDNGIEQTYTCLPKGWKSLTIKGVGPEKKTYVIR